MEDSVIFGNEEKDTNNSESSAFPSQLNSLAEKENSIEENTLSFFDRLGNRAIWFTLGIASAIILYVYWDFITFSKAFLFRDIGSDSINESWPILYHLSDHWYKDGIVFWSHQFGMGDTLYQFYGDPFTLLVILLGKEQIPFTIVFTQILAILLTVVFSFKYLKLLKLNTFTVIIGSLIFSFSGFIILTSSGWLMGPQFFYFTLGLYAIEMFLNNKRLLTIIISAFLLGCHNAILGIQFFVFFSFYCVIRQIELNDLKITIKSQLLKQGVFSIIFILGFLVAGVFVFNYLDLVFSSGRTEINNQNSDFSHQSPFQLLPAVELYSILARFCSNDLLGSGSDYKGWMNYFESPLTYVGLIPFIMCFYGIIYGHKTQRIVHQILFSLVLFGFSFPFIRYAFWGFQLNYFRVYSLFLAFFVFFIGIRTFNYVVLQRNINKSFINIVFGSLAFVLLSDTIIPQDSINSPFRNVVLLFLSIYAVLFYMIGLKTTFKETIWALMLGIIFELAVFTNTTVNDRSHLTSEELHSKSGYFDETIDEVEYLKHVDKNHYRVAKMYSSGPSMHQSLNDALIQDFMGLVSYSQFQKKGYLDFLNLYGFLDPKNPDDLKWSVKLLSDLKFSGLLGTKYILDKKPCRFDTSYLKPLKEFDEGVIFTNKLALPLFYVHHGVISKSDLSLFNPKQRRCLAFYGAVLDDKMIADWGKNKVKLDTNLCRTDSLIKQSVFLNKQDVTIKKIKNNEVSLEVHATEKGILCSSIPNHDGWHVTVDGIEMSKLLVNGGLIGFELTSGKHTVDFWFLPPKLYIGIISSTISLLILVILIKFNSKFKPLEKNYNI